MVFICAYILNPTLKQHYVETAILCVWSPPQCLSANTVVNTNSRCVKICQIYSTVCANNKQN